MLRALLNQTINFFSLPGEGFPGLPQELQYLCSLTMPVSGRQGGQLSTKSLEKDKMWSDFQAPDVWGHVCAVMTLETCVWLGLGSSHTLQMEARWFQPGLSLCQTGWPVVRDKIPPRALKRRPYFCFKQNSSISLAITFQQVIFFFLVRLLFTFFSAHHISCCIW